MGKISSSSSKKRKRYRDLSRRKKRRRIKSKKILRRNDHSDDSESSSAETSSYSSSEDDDYRRQKRRSKRSGKRSRRRDSSSDSEDETRRLKKKKRSKRKDEYTGKRRTRLRKRRGRDVSASSLSSESYSTSSSENSSGESEGGRKRGRPERRDEDRGRLDKVKAKRRKRDESTSCSLNRQDVEPDDNQQVRNEITSVKGSRRLRSVIIVVTTSNEDYRMVHGCDDCSVSRGNESDGKREIECYEASEEHKTMDDEKYGEAIISSPRATVDEEASENAGEDDKMELSQDIHADDNLKGDDLESILKMRALENLRRFRGETQRNGVASKEAPSAAEGESLHIESVKVEESPGHGLVEQKPDVSGAIRDLKSSQKVLQGVDNHKESGSFSHDLASPEDQLGGTATDKVSGGVSSSTTRPKLIKPAWRREIANLSSCRQAAGIGDARTELTSGDTIGKDYPETSQTLAAKKGSENVEPEGNGTPNEQSSSCAETEVGSRETDKPHDETKEEFEEKTMSVMRGGEMVQVSYKVYIPKKSPALARRKLKR